MLPMAGEYTGGVLKAGIQKFCTAYRPDLLAPDEPTQTNKSLPAALETLGTNVQGRPPSFCTGCPERPIFSAMKLVQNAKWGRCMSAPISAVTPSRRLQPFNIGQATMGYGLGGAGASPLSGQGGKRPVSVVGDGGFWHNGLVSSVGHQVFNKTDGVMLIVDNGYAAATGGQDILSSAGRGRYPLDQASDREARCAASASNGSGTSPAPTTSPRCATPCARR